MRGARPHGGVPNELRPPNIYYDHGNARQTFHPPVRLQTMNGYISIQGKPMGPQPHDNRRQVPLHESGPSNSQDVRSMDGTTDFPLNESFFLPLALGK